MTESRDSVLAEPQQVPEPADRWLAWLLGFSLPLAGGLSLGEWLGWYPDQLTLIRLVTAATWAWLVVKLLRDRRSWALPRASRWMAVALLASLGYGLITLSWTPSPATGLHDVITIGLALASALALLLLVRDDVRVLRSYAVGLLWAAALQVAVAVVEVTTTLHLTYRFGQGTVEAAGQSRYEDIYGPIAYGSMGNPNDFGAFLTVGLAVFLAAGAYGIVLSRRQRIVGWIVVAAGVWVGFNYLANARGFQLVVLAFAAMYAVDRLAQRYGAVVRVVVLAALGLLAVVVFALLFIVPLVNGSWTQSQDSSSDMLRLELVAQALQESLNSFGFGRGLGAEQVLIESGAISLNFHNTFARLAAEVGLVIAVAYVLYLLALIAKWAFPGKPSADRGPECRLARASAAVALLVWGVVVSGVLDSPAYWTVFAATAAVAAIPAGSRADLDRS